MPLVSGASYASVAQFFGPGGLPPTALGALTTADVQRSLDTSTADLDSLAFRGVYGNGFKFSAVGLDVARRCVQHAKYLLMSERGFSPETGSDTDITRGETEFQAWCDRVHRRVEFPDVTIETDPNFSAQPFVSSLPPRGWQFRRTAD